MKPSTWGVEKAVPTLITGGFFLHLITLSRALAFEGTSPADVILWPVDFALFVLMAYSALVLILRHGAVARRFDMRPRWRRVGYWVITAYVVVSLPIHVVYLATGNIDLITGFPWWFSGAILPVYVVILAYFFSLRPLEEADRAGDAAVSRSVPA